MTRVVSLGGFADLPAEIRAGYVQIAALRAGADLTDSLVPAFFRRATAPVTMTLATMFVAGLPRPTLESLPTRPTGSPPCRTCGEHLAALRVPLVARVGDADVAVPPALRLEFLVQPGRRAA